MAMLKGPQGVFYQYPADLQQAEQGYVAGRVAAMGISLTVPEDLCGVDDSTLFQTLCEEMDNPGDLPGFLQWTRATPRSGTCAAGHRPPSGC